MRCEGVTSKPINLVGGGGLHHQVWNILHLNASRLNNMESNIDFYLYCRYCTPPEWTMPFRFSAMRGGHFQLNKSGWGGGGIYIYII